MKRADGTRVVAVRASVSAARLRLPAYDGPAPVPAEADDVYWGQRPLATPLGRYDGTRSAPWVGAIGQATS